MSKLEELIQELCPDGVEYKPFFDIAKYIRGVTYNKSCEITDGSDGYKLLRANNITLANNSLNLDDIKTINFGVKVKDEQFLKKDDILICAGSGSKDHIGKVAFISEDMKYTFGGFMGVIRANIKFISPRYLYHILTSKMFKEHLYKISDANSTTINNINNNTWKKFFVPIPTLEVQKEIVRLLDEFTAKTAELQAELNKEYEARKKQYEYYRDNLLLHNSHSKEVKLGEVATIGDGLHSTPKYDDNGSYYFINGNNIKNGALYLTSNTKRCSESEYSKYKKYIPKSTVMMSINGTIGSVGIYNNEPIILGKSIAYFITTEQLSDKFLYHYLQTSKSSTYFRNHVTGSTIKNLGLKALRNFQIYLPPIIDQKSIIRKLDEYESMSEGLQSKISSEIESRQKQYEFYRDKLLTFKELK